MNLIFMRHGEASNNVKEYLSDKEIYWSLLTRKGQNEVKESIKSLPTKLFILLPCQGLFRQLTLFMKNTKVQK